MKLYQFKKKYFDLSFPYLLVDHYCYWIDRVVYEKNLREITLEILDNTTDFSKSRSTLYTFNRDEYLGFTDFSITTEKTVY